MYGLKCNYFAYLIRVAEIWEVYCNSRIVYMLYDDELYMLKSNKIYVMLCCYVILLK